MKTTEIVSKFLQHGFLKHGEFTLASGKQSSYYVDAKSALLNNDLLELITDKMLSLIRATAGHQTLYAGGPELGVVPLIGSMLAIDPGMEGFIIRKAPREHGLTAQTVGLPNVSETFSRKTCILVDDVATTGQSLMHSLETLWALGHDCRLVYVVVDREEGARTLLESHDVRLFSLLTAQDLLQAKPA